MNPTTTEPNPVSDPATTRRVWLLSVTARREPQLLSRLLSKLAVPEIELIAVEFRTETGLSQRVRCGFCLQMTSAWAELIVAKLRHLVPVEEVASVRL